MIFLPFPDVETSTSPFYVSEAYVKSIETRHLNRIMSA